MLLLLGGVVSLEMKTTEERQRFPKKKIYAIDYP